MIFPTNQSKCTSDNTWTNEISHCKSQIKVQIVSEQASKQASCKWKLNLWAKCLTFGENRGNIQKIYDSARKELQLRWMSLRLIALERDSNLSDLAVREDGWEVESLCWFGIITQAGRVEFTAAMSEGIKSIILVSCLVHSSKFKWSFFEPLTAKTRQPIGRVKFDFKHSQSVA